LAYRFIGSLDIENSVKSKAAATEAAGHSTAWLFVHLSLYQ